MRTIINIQPKKIAVRQRRKISRKGAFGILKIKYQIDGVAYQHQMRSEWADEGTN